MSAPQAETIVRISETTLNLFQQLDITTALLAMLPELLLALTAVLVVMLDLVLKREQAWLNGMLAMAGTLMAFAVAVPLGFDSLGMRDSVLLGTYLVDPLTGLLRVLAIGTLLATLAMSLIDRRLAAYHTGEYYALLLMATTAMCLMVAAGNLVLFLLAFETLSLFSYVLVAYLKGTRLSSEASLKYLLFGAMASGVMFCGLSYLYGLSGTMETTRAVTGAFESANPVLAMLALIMVLAGLGFKISMVPFHFWTPDAYTAAPTPVAAWLSVASKAAALGVLVRLVWPLGDLLYRQAEPLMLAADIPALFGVLAILTMSLGNLAALRQHDFKRLFAYSSIAHAGYMLMAFASLSTPALAGLLGYLPIYLCMNMAAFLFVVMADNDRQTTEISAFRGYFHQRPLAVVMLAIVMFSLIGLPPVAGFLAKFWLFLGVMKAEGAASAWPIMLVVVAVLNTVVSLYYYVYPLKVMILEKAEGDAPAAVAPAPAALVLLALLVLPLLLVFVMWSPFQQLMHAVALNLR